jgi:3-phosphoshikimate 1-carboxyvinyltransferase
MQTYPETITLTPLDKAPDAVVAIPGSKSITNRALILAALADGTTTLTNALFSDDTRVMTEALKALGFEIQTDTERETITVVGQDGKIPASEANLFCGNSGTSIRFLTALCALGKGSTYTLDGIERMRQRPQGDLLDALQSQGVGATSEFGNGCPPLHIHSRNGLEGGSVSLRADASSQFVTALLIVAPYANETLEIVIEGNLRPFYVTMTRQMMAQWGVHTKETERGFVVPAGQCYNAQPEYAIEPDASSASYFFAAAALLGGKVTIPNLSPNALQGDVRFATEVLTEMGCTVTHDDRSITVAAPADGILHGITRDMSAISDTSLTLAALAPFADSPTTVTGIAHSRLQECDRISAICTELIKLGVQVEEHPDGFTIYPAAQITPANIETYHDHRVAMSFALIGLKVPGITIANPACVAKTFPDYWQRLERLR